MALKEQISDAAFGLFARNGIKRVSMYDVSRQAGVSKRTLYEFFGDKEALVVNVIERMSSSFRNYISILNKEKSNTALDILLLYNDIMSKQAQWLSATFFEDLKRFPAANEKMTELKSTVFNTILSLFKRGVREKVFLEDVNFDLISRIFHEHISTESPSIFTDKYTQMEVHNTIFYIFLRGVCTVQGLEFIDGFYLKKKMKENFINNY